MKSKKKIKKRPLPSTTYKSPCKKRKTSYRRYFTSSDSEDLPSDSKKSFIDLSDKRFLRKSFILDTDDAPTSSEDETFKPINGDSSSSSSDAETLYEKKVKKGL